MTCLDPQYRIVIQCLNSVYILSEHEIVKPKLRMLKELTDGNDYNINDTQSDIIEELTHAETDAIVLNESANKPDKPNQMLGNNQNEDVTQTYVQIKTSPNRLKN